jgi:hypothetical protein
MEQRQRKLVRLGAVILGIVVLGSGLYGFRGPLARQLHAWKILPSTERFTELYFSDAAHLPDAYRPNEPLTLRFRVHNQEGTQTTYHYVVTANGVGSRQLTTGSFIVQAGMLHEEAVTVRVPDIGLREQIAIRLVDQRQVISFWLNKGAAQ